MLNWQAVKNITHGELGRFLALMIVAWSPFSGGPRLPSLLLALMGVWMIVTQGRRLFQSSAIRRWCVIFGLLWLPAVLSIPGSFVWQRSAGIALVLLVYFFAGLALIQVLRSDQHRAWLIKWLAIVLTIWVVDGLIQYVLGKDLLLIPLSEDGRVVGMFAGDLHLSLFLAILLPLLLWRTIDITVVGTMVLCVAAIVLVLLGGSRGTLVMVVLAALIAGWRLFGRYRLPVFAAATIIAAGLLILAPTPVLKERIERSSLHEGISFDSINHVLSHRLYIWDTAVNMVRDRPLTGVGIGAFAAVYDAYSRHPADPFRHGSPNDQHTGVYHAHQMYVSIAAETGLVGLAAIIAAYILCVTWYFMAPPTRRNLAWPFALSLFVASFPINSQPVLFTHWYFPVLLLLLCAMLATLGDESMVAESRGRVAAKVAA